MVVSVDKLQVNLGNPEDESPHGSALSQAIRACKDLELSLQTSRRSAEAEPATAVDMQLTQSIRQASQHIQHLALLKGPSAGRQALQIHETWFTADQWQPPTNELSSWILV